MIEVRIHGRGGQGAVTSAELVALAAIAEGKYAQAFPSFGPERRGAPVLAFIRTSDQPIRVRSGILQPDVVVVLDEPLITVGNALSGLKKDGTIIINTQKSAQEIKREYNITTKVAVVNATKIAREVLGLPITNTTMLGALVKVTGIVKLESLIEPLKHRFGRIAEKNINVCRRAYEETVMEV
ncbi:MAG TPA: pyruvate ferredoxin oxidoreductase subunit gamma [Thermodesulfobacteriota bacterium]|nr:pyruvate ferredoxin oxidoreductase subunit gamma [Thermodesulfobacteriota bacterium]